MVKFLFRAIGALVVAFVVQGILPAGFHQVVGQRMLEAAAWTPGVRPPDSYMVITVLARVVAAALAGIVAALIVGRARIRLALAYGALFAGGAAWASRATLLDSPHPYEWPLVLAPLMAMPLGAWLVVRFKPLQPEGTESPVGS